ncbi:MAG: helix-turn-helix domain-containing protein [Chloroflexi bacterium]|nr:helix-turn-helix domain-containing protein [Ktedonobacteraceae bacterium]MBV9707853.1 helix-turn-helix domain-containing protein [Chloroflexota bacterium]
MIPLLTTEEVAEYLRVDVVTVRRLINRGELTAYRVGSEYRFAQTDLEAYLQRQRVSAGEEEGPVQEEMPSFAMPKQRFKGRHGDRDRFDKFTERARKVLTLSQEEAKRFHHNYVGTEHLLLGLISEGGGVAAKVLANLGVELNRVRIAVEFIIGRGEHLVPGEIGLTPRAKKVIELAVDEARHLHHHYIGTEHLLLGLLREGSGIAAEILKSLGLSMEQTRMETLRVLSDVTRQAEEHAETTEEGTEVQQAEVQEPVEEQHTPPPAVPAEVSSLLTEGEQGLICSRCNAHNPAYFHYCFNCGQQLAPKEQA